MSLTLRHHITELSCWPRARALKKQIKRNCEIAKLPTNRKTTNITNDVRQRRHQVGPLKRVIYCKLASLSSLLRRDDVATYMCCTFCFLLLNSSLTVNIIIIHRLDVKFAAELDARKKCTGGDFNGLNCSRDIPFAAMAQVKLLQLQHLP